MPSKIIGAGIHGDTSSYLDGMWWFYFNTWEIHNPHPDWPFIYYYQFYPSGAPINELGMFYEYLGAILIPIFQNVVLAYNFLIYFSFILTGYGTFQLANYLLRNYYASLVSGVIFTFGTFQMFHVNGHLNLLNLEFIPLTILFTLKAIQEENKKNILVASGFLFLVFIAQSYLAFFMLFFLVSFFIYLMVRRAKIRSFVILFSIMLIGFGSSLPINYETLIKGSAIYIPPAGQAVGLSAELLNYVLPTPHSYLGRAMHGLTAFGSAEGWAFLGFVTIFLVLITLFKPNRKEKSLWIISAIILGLVSLGPFLKIHGGATDIRLPYYILYQLPIFNLFRGVGEASVFVSLSVAILAGYGFKEICNIRKFTKHTKLLIVCITITLIVLEFLTPIPSKDVPIPSIYYDIKKDPTQTVVLESPIGRFYNNVANLLETDRAAAFYQTVHEKPMYSGDMTREPPDAEGIVQTYFLNQFVWDQPRYDIVKQSQADVGVSLFNHFNVGYVVVRKDLTGFDPSLHSTLNKIWLPQTHDLLFTIFHRGPDYEDKEIYVYKVPKSTSPDPYIVLGNGWSPLVNFYRTMQNNGTILIVNPSNTTQTVEMNIELTSPTSNEIGFILNKKEVYNTTIDQYDTSLVSLNLQLNNGTNDLEIVTNGTIENSVPTLLPTERNISFGKIGLAVTKISMKTTNITSNNKIGLSADDPIQQKIILYSQISQIWKDKKPLTMPQLNKLVNENMSETNQDQNSFDANLPNLGP